MKELIGVILNNQHLLITILDKKGRKSEVKRIKFFDNRKYSPKF